MVFVTGTTGEYKINEYGTVAYDAATGSTAWVRFLKGQPTSAQTTYAYARAIAVSPNGSEVFVTGERSEQAGGLFGTVAYGAATGTRLWLASYGGTSGSPAAITVSPDSATVFITGTGPASMTTLAYSP